MENKNTTPLHVRPKKHNPEKPFDGDLFNRQKLAEQLTGMVERMADGCVFAIDAPWGEGKTWFGENWVSKLRADGFSVVFIDAFRQDYVEDPFLMVCSEILAAFKGGEARNKLTDAGKMVVKRLLPITAKLAVRFVGHRLLGSVDMTEEFRKTVEEIEKGAENALETQLAKRLTDHAEDTSSVEGFAKVLEEQAKSLKKPLVVVIDELDRCRPDFAVRTVERIKHFFDVPGVVFVLLVNRPQLEAAIQGVYGTEVDAKTYLGKFVQFWLRLPKNRPNALSVLDNNLTYCKELARRFGLDKTPEHSGFLEVFANLASLKGLSLRDLERGYTLYSLAQPVSNASAFFGWAIYLKLVRPDVHAGILAGEPAAHESAREVLATMIETAPGLPLLTALDDLHRSLVDEDNPSLSEQTKSIFMQCGSWGIVPARFLPWLYGKIDLHVGN
ncbi:MAG: hypothetical protein HQL87_00320 [Magnetococcales bacterium]|nr:hypothetical protein [Magnetococcales bacterium]